VLTCRSAIPPQHLCSVPSALPDAACRPSAGCLQGHTLQALSCSDTQHRLTAPSPGPAAGPAAGAERLMEGIQPGADACRSSFSAFCDTPAGHPAMPPVMLLEACASDRQPGRQQTAHLGKSPAFVSIFRCATLRQWHGERCRNSFPQGMWTRDPRRRGRAVRPPSPVRARHTRHCWPSPPAGRCAPQGDPERGGIRVCPARQ
jgi:hypothetical protein